MLDEPKKIFPDWRSYIQEELDENYNQSTLVPDTTAFRQQKVELSAKARAELDCILDVAYGPTKAEVLDIFPAPTKGAPINIYIHGGAWKSGHKDDVSFPAPVFHTAGANFVAVNFNLVPDVMLEELVRQCRAAIAWVYRNADTFGGDRERIYVSGHSSGGHVTGVMTITDWEGAYGLPADLVKGAAPISGMFDLEPVINSWRNSYLKLDAERALALSTIHHIPEVKIPMVFGFGSGELTEFQRQSTDCAAAWKAAGQEACLIEVPDKNHYQMGADYGNPQSPVTQAIFDQMSL